MMMLEICEGAHHALKYLCVVQCGLCAWRRILRGVFDHVDGSS